MFYLICNQSVNTWRDGKQSWGTRPPSLPHGGSPRRIRWASGAHTCSAALEEATELCFTERES